MMTCHVSQYDGTNSDIVEHIQVIYQICRGHRFDKTRKLIHKHSLKMEHIMPMALDTELFAAVLVALTRIQHLWFSHKLEYGSLQSWFSQLEYGFSNHGSDSWNMDSAMWIQRQ